MRKLLIFGIGHLQRGIRLHHQRRQQEALVFIRQESPRHAVSHRLDSHPEEQQQGDGNDKFATQ